MRKGGWIFWWIGIALYVLFLGLIVMYNLAGKYGWA